MLTDEDKRDIFIYIMDRMADTESNSTRHDLVANTTRRLLLFITEHPDICAAELHDFLSNKEYVMQELIRLVG
jgi:hypothetical protein